MHVHFIIPAYHENQRLPDYLNELLPTIRQSNLTISVQIVEDGSDTQTQQQLAEILSPLHPEFQFFMPTLFLQTNLGKGGAVYQGWQQAPPCDFLGFVDADGSIPAQELIRLVHEAEKNPAVALIGSRIRMLGKQVTRSARRHYIGRIYATMVGSLLNIPVYDSQCGIKLIPSSVFEKFSDDCIEYGFAFDLEILLQLNQHRCSAIEIPIHWHDTPGSKVSLFRDSIQMAFTLMRLRKRFRTSPRSS